MLWLEPALLHDTNSIYSFRKLLKTICLVAAAVHSDFFPFAWCTNTLIYLLTYPVVKHSCTTA